MDLWEGSLGGWIGEGTIRSSSSLSRGGRPSTESTPSDRAKTVWRSACQLGVCVARSLFRFADLGDDGCITPCHNWSWDGLMGGIIGRMDRGGYDSESSSSLSRGGRPSTESTPSDRAKTVWRSACQLAMVVVHRLVLGVCLFDLGLLRSLSRESREPEISLSSAVGADRGEGHEPLEVGALAGRARGRGRVEHQKLESVLALTALVFVDRHPVPLRGRVANS